MKNVIGVLLIICGAIFGIYVGIWRSLNTAPPKIMQRGIVTREFFDEWDGVTSPDGWCGGVGGGGVVVNTAVEVKDDTTHVVIEWAQDLAEEFKYFIDEVRRLKDLHGEVRFVFGFDS